MEMETRREEGSIFEWKVRETIFFTRKRVWLERSGRCTPGEVSQGGSCHLRGAAAGAQAALLGAKAGPGAPDSPALGALRSGGGEIRERAGGQKQHLSDTPFPSDLSNFPQRHPRTLSHRTSPHPGSGPRLGPCGRPRRGVGWECDEEAEGTKVRTRNANSQPPAETTQSVYTCRDHSPVTGLSGFAPGAVL